MLRQTHFVAPVPLLIARSMGLLERAGVKLHTTETRGSEEQFAQLVGGQQDLAVTAIDNLFEWNQRGADAVVIAQIERTTPLTLFARSDIADLPALTEGTFAVDALNNGFSLAARSVLGRAGVSVSFVEVGGVRERWEALAAGGVDATLLGPPFDTFATELGLSRLAAIGDLIPGYPGQALVVLRDALTRCRDELATYVGTLEAAARRSQTMSDVEGSGLLEASGFPPAAAALMWRERACTLRAEPAGIDVIAGVRRDLNQLPARYSGAADLLDGSIMDGSV
ncbi:ABC transporter substrate-binding protein [Kocuria sp.]|uniref:ABC transporter substrate-binding protein n=1 Tax=Kocuria TaxID=57493 RepID=UPI0025BAA1BC|nr:ABC transporter substrate-binding protein [Kocuria sp.]